MRNPWADLPEQPPYVLPCDLAEIAALNSKDIGNGRFFVGGDAFPEPFLGSPDAPLVLLSGNPGRYPHLDPISKSFYEACHPLLAVARKNLLHTSLSYPFWTLDPQFSGYPGFVWWSKRVKRLLELGIDRQRLSERLLCVEYFPYHTQNFGGFPLLDSQRYGFHLVAESIKRNAQIVVMRCKTPWVRAVPALSGYANLHVLSNVQNPRLSERQLPAESWEAVYKAVQ